MRFFTLDAVNPPFTHKYIPLSPRTYLTKFPPMHTGTNPNSRRPSTVDLPRTRPTRWRGPSNIQSGARAHHSLCRPSRCYASLLRLSLCSPTSRWTGRRYFGRGICGCLPTIAHGRLAWLSTSWWRGRRRARGKLCCGHGGSSCWIGREWGATRSRGGTIGSAKLRACATGVVDDAKPAGGDGRPGEGEEQQKQHQQHQQQQGEGDG